MARSLRVASQCIENMDAVLLRNGFPRQQDLADALGRSRDTISRFVTGKPVGFLTFTEICRVVVLIDEIDKADIDFPNDLLRELDEQKFTIEETGEEVKANYPPIVFVTSNDEKDLPDAFLRRCLFHYIEFPAPRLLIDIVNAHFPASSTDLIEASD